MTYILLFATFVSGAIWFQNYKANPSEQHSYKAPTQEISQIFMPEGNTLETRILPPPGYERLGTSKESFAAYLRQLPLKPAGSEVHYYNGATKKNNGVYNAVVDLPIGERDLHQCADAVMRLRAEYLWEMGRYDEIKFNFTNGFPVPYSEWMKGKRVVVVDNEARWVLKTVPSNTKEDFWRYLETIFMYAGTLSLSQELPTVSLAEMQIGDVFVQGGSPGHAVIVIDMAEHTETGKQIFLLAQSYMPAQELQILNNPADLENPWYSQNFEGNLQTPEWRFTDQDLKRFE